MWFCRLHFPECVFWDGIITAISQKNNSLFIVLLTYILLISIIKDIASWSVTVSFNKEFSKLSFFNALAVETTGILQPYSLLNVCIQIKVIL